MQRTTDGDGLNHGWCYVVINHLASGIHICTELMAFSYTKKRSAIQHRSELQEEHKTTKEWNAQNKRGLIANDFYSKML